LPLLAAARRGGWPLGRDSQLGTYFGLIAVLAALVGLWRWAGSDWSLADSLRYSVFSVTAVATTTGFVATDWGAWGGFAQVVFFLLAFVGGCTGSTAGGIKIFRWELLAGLVKVHVKRLLHPHGVFGLEFNRRRVSEQVVDSVLAFVVLYIVTFVVLALLLTVTGLDLVTALSGSAAALGNVGRGLGEVIGPAASWRALPDAAKWILSVEMVVGRLEVFTVLILFTPAFWRE
jgi:trk system potassium uptake protein TrkH